MHLRHLAPLLLLSPFAALAQAPGALQPLPNHHPAWANVSNETGDVPSEQLLDPMTVVLARSPQQQAAFESFLASQLNPASADYHHWLTSAEIAQRFGPSEQQIADLTVWLQSQGLQLLWTSPSHDSIGFKGSAGAVNRAFSTVIKRYTVHDRPLISVSTDPIIPTAVAPLIKAIRGLYTIQDRPFVHAQPFVHALPASSLSPDVSFNGKHFVAPADFATIYNIPAGATGAGATIGIVGRSRTNFADFENFRSLTGSTFPNPTEVIPTTYGGVDPGPAQTTDTGSTPDDQVEATLDVLRAGSVAPGARLLLVVSSNAGSGVDGDTQYLVETDPSPAQIISVSFGACESDAGPSGVNYWDSLFQTAAAKGISVFVASGDSGASGCDTYFATPPADPDANSPNYIGSSSYATVLGGTEFNDTADPGQYWSSTNGAGYSSALAYIPEGAWNEPDNSDGDSQAASSGGGVSSVIATPGWQTGTGVPAARAGRYTPDISFTSSGHDGYFGCLAASGSSCVVGSGGSFNFEYFYGTSAATPDMAGVAAMLNQKLGLFQGNLNPELYKLAATRPTVFHDATVATSGVAGCSVSTPSICNNSIPSPTALTGGQAGYLLTAGYDEVTGLGSLNIANFLAGYTATVSVAATPVISPAAGTYLTPKTISMTDATAGAAIYYTTNDTTPTTASTRYTAPFMISTAKTIKAIAIASGYTNSAVATSSFYIQTATPTFSPVAGTYSAAQTVTFKDASAGTITYYYTTNGATPTTASTKYTAPIKISATTTIKAIAVATGDTTSSVATAVYTINTTRIAATPVISPAAGTYLTPKTISMTDATAGAAIYYTTNDTTPTTASTRYTAPFMISTAKTIKAIAIASGYTNSAVATSSFYIQTATPTFSPVAGTYSAAQTVTFKDASAGTITYYYTTNGATPTTASTRYTAPIKISATTTIKAIAVATGDTTSSVATAVYTITAAQTGVTASPATASYPFTALDNSAAPQTITFKNNGTAAVSSLAIALTGTGASSYSKTQTCGTTLAAGASCNVALAHR